MPTPCDDRAAGRPRPRTVFNATLLAGFALTIAGCGGPTARELKNRQEFEALLSAVSLKSRSELERDAKRIEARRDAGGLSEAGYLDLQEIIVKARAGDWVGAESKAYEFRERRPYFK